jgi:putative hemolysin
VNVHVVEGIVFLVALLLAAMSAAAETAFTALAPATLHSLEERGGIGRTIAALRRDPNRFLSTILVVSSTSLIVASSMATLLFVDTLPSPLGEIVATAGVSIIVLIFAELTPKTFAVRKPRGVALFLARPVRVFELALRPVIASTGAIVSVLMGVLGQGRGNPTIAPSVTEDDVRSTIILAEQTEGGLTEEETDRIEGILDLDTVVVEEVMRPRVDIVAVPVEMKLMDALDVVIQAGHSRIPVYDGSIDKVVGILYDKDLLKYLRENETTVSLREVARPAIFVPESKRAADLLREFQRKKVHMAIVFDEYGGTAGLVTIEDILEEIVGEIQDEYDREPPAWEKVSDDEWVFSAMVRVEEVNELMGTHLEIDNGETLGGFMFERLGEVPDVGDMVTADHANLEVVEVEGRRIKKIRITLVADSGDAAGSLEQ